METIRANFLTQATNEPTKGDAAGSVTQKAPKLFRDGKVEAVFAPETVKCQVLDCPCSKAAKLYLELYQQKQIQ